MDNIFDFENWESLIKFDIYIWESYRKLETAWKRLRKKKDLARPRCKIVRKHSIKKMQK